MDYMISEGKTIGRVSFNNGAVVRISIISKRAAALVIRQSRMAKWKTPVVAYELHIKCNPRLYLVAFQPETGTHIAVIKEEVRQ